MSSSCLSRRFKTDLPTTVSKSAPDFCNVYVISKGKIASVRNATRPAPFKSSMKSSEYENQQPVTPSDHSHSAVSTPSRPSKSAEADTTR